MVLRMAEMLGIMMVMMLAPSGEIYLVRRRIKMLVSLMGMW